MVPVHYWDILVSWPPIIQVESLRRYPSVVLASGWIRSLLLKGWFLHFRSMPKSSYASVVKYPVQSTYYLFQIANFLYSVPQLFHVVPCPRHRLPKFLKASFPLHSSQNWTVRLRPWRFLGLSFIAHPPRALLHLEFQLLSYLWRCFLWCCFWCFIAEKSAQSNFFWALY